VSHEWVLPEDLRKLAAWHKKYSTDAWHVDVCRAAAAELKRLRKLVKKQGGGG